MTRFPPGRPDMVGAQALRQIEEALGRWRGCAWATNFGRSELNLEGIWSSQARLMAQATTGQEASDWRHAALWLEQVEEDAALARAHAELAAELLHQGQTGLALEELDRACQIEGRYASPGVWQSAHRALAAEISSLEC